jgi:hypothetical protein
LYALSWIVLLPRSLLLPSASSLNQFSGTVSVLDEQAHNGRDHLIDGTRESGLIHLMVKDLVAARALIHSLIATLKRA